MKQIDFMKLNVETRIGQFDEIDVREELGNVLFSQATTLQEDELARKIYKSDGCIILDADEYTLMMNSLKQKGILFSVLTAIEKQAEDVPEET